MSDVELQNMRSLKVFVDADACPVKEVIIELCHAAKVEVIFVAAYTNISDRYPNVKWIWVEPRKDAADHYIFNHISQGDLVITDDIGLAAGCLSKGVYVLTSRGKELTDSQIDILLEARHVSAKARRAGVYNKGPKKHQKTDKNHFSRALQKILSKNEGFQEPI